MIRSDQRDFFQEEFVDGVYTVMREEAVPLSFDRQMYFVNYTLFDKQSPTYINLIREPADKALSRLIIMSILNLFILLSNHVLSLF